MAKKKGMKIINGGKTKVTQKEVMEKVTELYEMINNCDENKAFVAECVCFEIVNWCSYNYYEALGIFTEAMLRYRDVSMEVMNEEEKNE